MDKNRQSSQFMVYHKIKQAIIEKRLSPGTKLVEQTLSEQLEVSRTPIRNALKELQVEGFIKIIPNKGAQIIEPTRQEIIETYKIRTDLELLAIRYGLPSLITDDFEQLSIIIEKEIAALKANDILEYLYYNKSFHLYVASKSNNHFLVQFLEKVLDQTNVYLILYDTYYNVSIHDIEGIKEHKEILKALQTNDHKLVEERLLLHIENSLHDFPLQSLKDTHQLFV